jgi:hypothetical protein
MTYRVSRRVADPTNLSNHSRSHRSMSWRQRALILGTIFAFVVGGCGITDQNVGIHLRVWNRTGQPVVLSYEEPGHRLDLGRIEPDGLLTVESVFDARGPECHGPFVARSESGEEIARVDEACPGGEWSVTRPGSS